MPGAFDCCLSRWTKSGRGGTTGRAIGWPASGPDGLRADGVGGAGALCTGGRGTGRAGSPGWAARGWPGSNSPGGSGCRGPERICPGFGGGTGLAGTTFLGGGAGGGVAVLAAFPLASGGRNGCAARGRWNSGATGLPAVPESPLLGGSPAAALSGGWAEPGTGGTLLLKSAVSVAVTVGGGGTGISSWAGVASTSSPAPLNLARTLSA